MKKHLPWFMMLFLLVSLVSLFTPCPAQEADQLDVDYSIICRGVSDLEPVGPDLSFPVSQGRIYCFTRIIGAQTPTAITHVWYFGEMERARVNLNVKGIRWRTYSSKAIQPHEIGPWRVEVLDGEGTVLKVLQFITTAEAEVSAPEPAQTEMAGEEPSEATETVVPEKEMMEEQPPAAPSMDMQ